MTIYLTIITLLFLILCTGAIKSILVTGDEELSFSLGVATIIGMLMVGVTSLEKLKEEYKLMQEGEDNIEN